MKILKKILAGILCLLVSILSVAWIYPIFMILINSLKAESAIQTDTVFELPTKETFVGFANYLNALDSKGFFQSLIYSLFITSYLF